MASPRDLLVLIGWLQPLDIANAAIIHRGLQLSRNVLVILRGADMAPSAHLNPFTAQERIEMLRTVFPTEFERGRLIVRPLNEEFYNESLWEARIHRIVDETLKTIGDASRIGLLGDAETGLVNYPWRFPEWANHCVKVPTAEETCISMEQRVSYFATGTPDLKEICPIAIEPMIQAHRDTPQFQWLKEDAKSLLNFRAKGGRIESSSPIISVESVCEQSGCVLLVRRTAWPGRGLLALPGGFAVSGERIQATAIRELQRQTQISDQRGQLPSGVLRNYISDSAYFDDPWRDGRGCVVSQAFKFSFPRAKARLALDGSDALESAQWVKLSQLDSIRLYGDHRMIIRRMLNV